MGFKSLLRRRFNAWKPRPAAVAQIESIEPRVHLSAAAMPSTINNAEQLLPAGDDMYVTSHPQGNSTDLWLLHGDSDRSVLLKRSSGYIRLLTIYGGQLLFEAPTKVGEGLWKTNGTARGTSLLKAMPSSRFIDQFATVNGTVVFFTRNSDSAASLPNNGPDLWKTDGTRAGTVLLKQLNPGRPRSTAQIELVTSKRVLFRDTAVSEEYRGGEPTYVYHRTLFSTTGTVQGTVDLGQGRDQWLENLKYQGLNKKFDMLSEPLTYNGVTYFLASTAAGNPGLWRKTKTGGTLLAQFPAGSHIDSFTPTDAQVFFRVRDAGYTTSQLWSTNGTRAKTSMAKSFVGTIDDLAAIGNRAYFSSGGLVTATTGAHVPLVRIWQSNGTRAGTRRMYEVRGGSPDMLPGTLLHAAGDSIYFSAEPGTPGTVVWHWNTATRISPHVVRPR